MSALGRTTIGLALLGCLAFAGLSVGAEPNLHEIVRAAEAGDVVELEAREYVLDRPLVIDKPISILGQGRDETVIRSTASREGEMLRVRDASDVRLAKFTLDGQGNDNLSQGIVISGGSGHRLEELRIQNIPGTDDFGPHAIYASRNVTDSRFAHLVIRRIGVDSEWGAGIRIGEGGRGNVVEQNDLAELGRGGILTTHGSTDTVIRGNRVRDFGHAGPGLGIEVWGSGQRVVIEDNRVDHWISVDGQRDVAVRRNTVTGAQDAERLGSYGLELVNSSRVVMTDNVIEGGNHIGLSVSNRERKDLAYWARNEVRNCATWGAQIQGDHGGAHRMYFYKNIFEDTQRSQRSRYPSAAGHGFRFNGNTFQTVLHANRLVGNDGAGIQLGGENLNRLSFLDNVIRANHGPAVAGRFRGEAVLWKGNEVAGNEGGNVGLESRGFGGAPLPKLRVTATGSDGTLRAATGEPMQLQLSGDRRERITAVLWDLGEGVPQSGWRVEHRYQRAGTYRIAAIAWTNDGRGILVEADVVVTGDR